MTSPSLTLRAIKSFYVGGETRRLEGLPVESRRMVPRGPHRRVNPNGDYVVGQMYVQSFALTLPHSPLPILLWHGGGMTGSQWETTPDGRRGWLWQLLAAGYNVLVSDAVERGRSSWARYPELYAEPPYFRTKEEAWRMFRFGPAEGYSSVPSDRRAFPYQQFPIEWFDDFAKQWVPRWADHDDMALSAYSQLVVQTGPCIIIGHSQGAAYAATIAQRFPDLVHAVIAIEPGGMPTPVACRLPPHLIVWGDHFASPNEIWESYRALADDYIACAGQELGNRLETLSLPDAGLRGNSHFPMLDRNSDAVADLLLSWLSQQLN